jgi:4'-phosphopantetheinyl transferase
MLEIGSGQIHLWLTFYDEIREQRLLSDYWSLLGAAEREKHSRFRFERDRRQYLVTRALVRTVLSKYVGVDPQDWRFTTNAFGRPQIANENVGAADLTFNIAHTRGLIVLGIARDRELGVDVENVSAREACVEIADRWFAPEEVADLHRLPAEQQPHRFFEYWTLKESYIKARGLGLSMPLDRFWFRFLENERVCVTLRDAESRRWEFWQLRPATEYLIAVCAECCCGERVRLAMRSITPLASEEARSYPVSRASERALVSTNCCT